VKDDAGLGWLEIAFVVVVLGALFWWQYRHSLLYCLHILD
jgi:hypothetical protein